MIIPVWALKASLIANGALLGLLLLSTGVQQYRVNSAQKETANAQRETADTKLEMTALRLEAAEERTRFETAARDLERQHQEESDQIRTTLTKEMEDAKVRSDALVADLRDGNLRLRKHWQGIAADAQLSAAQAAAARADGSAELREAGAGDLVRIAANADSKIRALQGELQSVLRVCKGVDTRQ